MKLRSKLLFVGDLKRTHKASTCRIKSHLSMTPDRHQDTPSFKLTPASTQVISKTRAVQMNPSSINGEWKGCILFCVALPVGQKEGEDAYQIATRP